MVDGQVDADTEMIENRGFGMAENDERWEDEFGDVPEDLQLSAPFLHALHDIVGSKWVKGSIVHTMVLTLLDGKLASNNQTWHQHTQCELAN